MFLIANCIFVSQNTFKLDRIIGFFTIYLKTKNFHNPKLQSPPRINMYHGAVITERTDFWSSFLTCLFRISADICCRRTSNITVTLKLHARRSAATIFVLLVVKRLTVSPQATPGLTVLIQHFLTLHWLEKKHSRYASCRTREYLLNIISLRKKNSRPEFSSRKW
jgi:hypothetical protein